MTFHGGVWNKAQGVPTPGYHVDKRREEWNGWDLQDTLFSFLKKRDWRSAYSCCFYIQYLSIFNKKEGKKKPKPPENIIYGWGPGMEVIFSCFIVWVCNHENASQAQKTDKEIHLQNFRIIKKQMSLIVSSWWHYCTEQNII